MELSSPEEAQAMNFYGRLLEDFKKTSYWPKGGDTALFTLEHQSSFTSTPNVLGYYLRTDNAVHLFVDTSTVMQVLRSSMSNPTRKDLMILFAGAVLVHEFSAHWSDHNIGRDAYSKQLEARFDTAFSQRTLNDSIVVPYLYDYILNERDAYLLTLKYLMGHVKDHSFSKQNFHRAVVSSATGFYGQVHDPSQPMAQYMHQLADNVQQYSSHSSRPVGEAYAIDGYARILALLTEAIHQMYQLGEKVR